VNRLRQVLAAIPAIGLTAALILYGVTPQEMGDAVVDATVVLRSMGRPPDAIVDLLVAESGAARAEVDPVVRRAVGSVGRDPRSLRTVDLAVLVAVADVPAAVEAYAQAFCAPLLAFADADHPIVAECLTAQRAASGAPQCVGADVAGYLVRTPATPPQAVLARERLTMATVIEGDPAAELAARGWVGCPSE
jgi:hypothetical protein